MKLTTEQLDRLADIGAAAAFSELTDRSSCVYVDSDPEILLEYKDDAPARRAFVEAVVANLPDSDWPLTRDAFSSRGITTDEAAADWVSIANDKISLANT